MSAETYSGEMGRPLSVERSEASRRSIGGAILLAWRGELTHGATIKQGIAGDLNQLISDTDYYQDDSETLEDDNELLACKLFRFRPRLVGAMAAYQHIVGVSYDNIVDQRGLESFYSFWALGSIQDDFIDDLPKQVDGSSSLASNRSLIGQAIFGDERKFYRAAYHQLRTQIKESDFGEAQTQYISGKVYDWYRFLIDQEAEVLSTPFDEMSFEYCQRYREQQNMRAGSTLAAMMNGSSCLQPERQQAEGNIAQFSYLTQIIDDIADTAEDMRAERPSYAVGALIDNPHERQRMSDYVHGHPGCKITPRQFKKLAPQAYGLIDQTFSGYCAELQKSPGGSQLTTVATAMFHGFPYVRNALYKISPKYANF